MPRARQPRACAACQNYQEVQSWTSPGMDSGGVACGAPSSSCMQACMDRPISSRAQAQTIQMSHVI
eukprot:365321-Chlamydomonas_euryale.AAC.4